MNQEQFGQFWEQLKSTSTSEVGEDHGSGSSRDSRQPRNVRHHSTEALWGIAQGRSKHVGQATLCSLERKLSWVSRSQASRITYYPSEGRPFQVFVGHVR